MNSFKDYLALKYKLKNLILDPIYNSIQFTSGALQGSGEKTERDLIDNQWLQRLRKIHQLQSTFWVYPSAENSRFTHSIGTMHIAGEFGKVLFRDLKENFEKECPSMCFIEEFLRLCGLLHDIGHGPFGHMFDESFLEQKYQLNHEKIGEKIINTELAGIISKIKRSPSGFFNEEEKIKPEYISYVINRSAKYKLTFPLWLKALRALFCGKFFTVDNLDYVLRDSYFTGYSKDPIKTDRIMFYTSINKEGLVFASAGRNTFKQFLNIKSDLYNSVYFHRTVRSIDLAIESIFYKTMERFCNFNPVENLEKYLDINEWSLFNTCKGWINSKNKTKKELGSKWCKIISRERTWFVALERELTMKPNQEALFFSRFFDSSEFEKNIYDKLIEKFGEDEIKNVTVTVDTKKHDPRPLDINLEEKMKIFDSHTNEIEEKRVLDWIKDFPSRIIIFRVYTNNKDYIKNVSEISNNLMSELDPAFTTNI